MPYSKLTDKDIAMIESYIDMYAINEDCSSVRERAPLTDILSYWNGEKARFLLPIFGDRLILEKQITYTKEKQELASDMYREVCCGEHPFQGCLLDKIQQEFGYWNDTSYNVMRLFDQNTLVTNRAENCTRQIITFNDGDYVTIDPAAKTMRLLNKLAKHYHLEAEFEDFRLAHSMVLNQKQFKGTLCLSIHPLDYMTMSDNNNNWSSCMSWMGEGDYRLGTVEMMNSPYVVVAYLRSDDVDLRWNNYHWNSKKWRSLIIVDPTRAIISVKNYPFENKDLTTMCIDWIRELIHTNTEYKFPKAPQEIHEEASNMFDNKEVYIECTTCAMYNDFGNATHWGCVEENCPDSVVIDYSGPTNCMWCGKETGWFEDRNYVCCSDCIDIDSNINYCEQCGERLYEDDICWVGDTSLCWCCRDRLTVYSELSGEYIWQDDAVPVYLAKNNVVDPDRYIYIENYHLRPEHSIWEYYYNCLPHQNEDGEYYWNVEDLTDAGLRCFDITNLDAYLAN